MHAWLKFAQVTLTCDVWSGLPQCASRKPESPTSFCSTPPQPPQTTCSTKPGRASLTGIRTHLSATSLEGQSGHLADSIPLTGCEPNTCIDVSSEHTPINYSCRKNSFNNEDNVTTTAAATEISDVFQKQAAANGSSQFVPTSEVNGSCRNVVSSQQEAVAE